MEIYGELAKWNPTEFRAPLAQTFANLRGDSGPRRQEIEAQFESTLSTITDGRS